jgi:hypothetical protein
MCLAIGRIGPARKKGASRNRTRRVREGDLAGDGGRGGGAREARKRGSSSRGRGRSRHTSLAPLYGYAPRGKRLRLSVPRKRGKVTTLLASISSEGIGPTLAVEGATTAAVFEAYVERVLAPSLEVGQIVVMDKLGAHRPKRVREPIEESGTEPL